MALQLPSFNVIIGFFPLKNTQQGNGSIFSTGVFLSFDHLSVCIQDIKLTSTGSTPNHFKPNTPQDTATPRNTCYTVKYQSTHGVNRAVLQQPVGTYRIWSCSQTDASKATVWGANVKLFPGCRGKIY